MEEVQEDRKRGMGIYCFYICMSSNVTLTNAVKEDFVLADLNVRYLNDFGVFIYCISMLVYYIYYDTTIYRFKAGGFSRNGGAQMSSLLT